MSCTITGPAAVCTVSAVTGVAAELPAGGGTTVPVRLAGRLEASRAAGRLVTLPDASAFSNWPVSADWIAASVGIWIIVTDNFAKR